MADVSTPRQVELPAQLVDRLIALAAPAATRLQYTRLNLLGEVANKVFGLCDHADHFHVAVTKAVDAAGRYPPTTDDPAPWLAGVTADTLRRLNVELVEPASPAGSPHTGRRMHRAGHRPPGPPGGPQGAAQPPSGHDGPSCSGCGAPVKGGGNSLCRDCGRAELAAAGFVL